MLNGFLKFSEIPAADLCIAWIICIEFVTGQFNCPFITVVSPISHFNYNDDKNLGRTLMGQNAWNNVLIATCHEKYHWGG